MDEESIERQGRRIRTPTSALGFRPYRKSRSNAGWNSGVLRGVSVGGATAALVCEMVGLRVKLHGSVSSGAVKRVDRGVQKRDGAGCGAQGGVRGEERQKGEPTLCSCGTITTMGYRTAAIAGEMPNGLQDRAGLAVRTYVPLLVVAWRTGGRSRQERREGGISSDLVCLCALPSTAVLASSSSILVSSSSDLVLSTSTNPSDPITLPFFVLFFALGTKRPVSLRVEMQRFSLNPCSYKLFSSLSQTVLFVHQKCEAGVLASKCIKILDLNSRI